MPKDRTNAGVLFGGDAPRIQGTDHAALEIDALSVDRANQTFPESDASEPDASWIMACAYVPVRCYAGTDTHSCA